MKVICAGYPKTGTKSVARALRILGYDKVYDFEESVEFAFDEWENILLDRSEDIDEVIDKIYSRDVEAVVDFPHSIFFEYFHKRWPEAKVILVIREVNSAFRSFKDMREEVPKKHPIMTSIVPFISPTSRRMKKWMAELLYLAMGSATPNKEKWTLAYRRHNAFVKSVIPPEKLLIYNVTQGWEPICKFLNKEIPKEHFPFENKAGSKRSISQRVMDETTVGKRIKMEAAIFVCLVPVVFALFLYWFLW